MAGTLILDAVHTPIGRSGGGLAQVRPVGQGLAVVLEGC
jgi:hypothetical protein